MEMVTFVLKACLEHVGHIMSCQWHDWLKASLDDLGNRLVSNCGFGSR